MEQPLSTSTLIELELDGAPDHPVLPDARKYDVQQLRFVWGYEEGPEGRAKNRRPRRSEEAPGLFFQLRYR